MTKILLPCCGVDAPGHALKNLGLRYQAYAWDIDASLRTALTRTHRSCVDLRLGPMSGDLLRLRCADVPDANLLAAGPPCPPWSSLGSGDSWDDPRALVFHKVCDMVVDQAARQRPAGWQHAFWGFVLENVQGMMHVTAADRDAGNKSPMGQIVAMLQARLGDQWLLEVTAMESHEGGLPQKRTRPYIRGTRKDLLAVSPLPPSLLRGGCDLGSFLNPVLPRTNKVLAGSGNKYMANLRKFKV